MKLKSRLNWLIVLVALGLQGCASYAWDSPAAADVVPTEGGGLAQHADPRGADDTFVVLAFSGGGMRSAAFSYGLLEALRDTRLSVAGRPRRLLDEVDVITSVSGGSYTAAYYGLFGERTFSDFEQKFLKRDIQGGIQSLLLNPLALASMVRSDTSRSDVAAAWLGNEVFDNKTVGEMRRSHGPMVIINASDINTGITFSFIQQQFDFLCSKIDDYPVSRAVMASSAVPGYFAPIAVRNYAGDCPQRRNSWVRKSLEAADIYSRDYQVARALDRYMRPKAMPVVRLADGGITDNLGVRGSMMSPVMHLGNVADMAGAFDQQQLDRVSKVLVIVANAQTYEDYGWSRDGRDPGLIGSLSASFDSAIGILNNETIGLARRGFMEWAERVNRRKSRAGKPAVEVSFVALTFDRIRDPVERQYFNSLPMSLALPARQIDELRALAGRLLNESQDYSGFINGLR